MDRTQPTPETTEQFTPDAEAPAAAPAAEQPATTTTDVTPDDLVDKPTVSIFPDQVFVLPEGMQLAILSTHLNEQETYEQLQQQCPELYAVLCHCATLEGEATGTPVQVRRLPVVLVPGKKPRSYHHVGANVRGIDAGEIIQFRPETLQRLRTFAANSKVPTLSFDQSINLLLDAVYQNREWKPLAKRGRRKLRAAEREAAELELTVKVLTRQLVRSEQDVEDVRSEAVAMTMQKVEGLVQQGLSTLHQQALPAFTQGVQTLEALVRPAEEFFATAKEQLTSFLGGIIQESTTEPQQAPSTPFPAFPQPEQTPS